FGGGGAFDVADPVERKAASSNKGTTAPVGVSSAPAAVSNAPAAATSVAPVSSVRHANQASVKAARIEVKADSKADLEAAWDHYFATLPVPDAAHASAVARERNESVRETVRQLTNDKKFGEVAALIRGALRNGYGQPWMYEALGLTMVAAGEPREEIERSLMSAVQFASSANDLLYIAAYMSRNGFDARALKVYRQAAQLEPTRYEPYIYGLAIAERLKDIGGLEWACVGVMSQAWPDDKLNVVQKARHVAAATIEQLKKENRASEADRFQAALNEALIRDCVVHVSWTGDAEVDLTVQEPAGSVCSFRNPRTTAGGIMLSSSPDRTAAAAGEPTSEDYVVTRGFTGSYKMLVRRVWGKLSANKITVDVYTHLGTKRAERVHKQIPIGEKDAVVAFELKDGRRTEPLADAQVANAIQNVAGLNRTLLAQMAGAQGAAPAVNQQVAATLPNRAV
ncbi:MAG TPA: hypothetical protein VKB78_04190, partial [Pirellulales bacterium]|nr:hypothetical protein [Pirellulales bacterium]